VLPLGYTQRRVHGLLRAGWEVSRAHWEATGDCGPEWDGFAEVIDIERALTALQHADPGAALVVVATMHGFTFDEMDKLFRALHIGWKARLDEAEVFMAAWLSGLDAEFELDAYKHRDRSNGHATGESIRGGL
jgi:hypothetical protein